MKAKFAEHLIATGRIDQARLESIPRSEWLYREPIGRLAMLHGLLGGAEIEEILRQQHSDDRLFGQIAVRMGMLTPEQLDVLVRGQAIRACLELIEDLALGDIIEFGQGLQAVMEFIAGCNFEEALEGNVLGGA